MGSGCGLLTTLQACQPLCLLLQPSVCLLPAVPAAGCPSQVLVTCTRNQAVDAVVDKLARVEGSLLVFGGEERLGSKAKRFLLKERVAQHPHVLGWLSWIEELQELMQLVEQAPAEGDEEDAAAVLDEALSLVRLPSYCPACGCPANLQQSKLAALQSGS